MNKLHLVIKTNKYTGNFERELIGFVFGYDDNTDGYAQRELNIFDDEVDEITKEDIHDCFDCYALGRNDGEYHCTFINSHPTNSAYDCDSIFIVLKKKFPDEIKNIIKQRLKMFCEIYNQEKSTDLKILDLGYYHQQLVKDGGIEY